MRGDERLGAVPEVKPLGTTDPVVIGPYRLLGVLGTGGMGRVYLGTSNTGRRVAIKVIRPDLAEDPVFRTRFAREVAAARRVSPLFTAAVVDADTLASEPWLATTYIDGIGLDRQVNTHGPLGSAAVLDLGAGLGEAFTSIHGAGLVHRDLKPSNILLNATGPHIIDFGLALAPEHVRMTTSLVFGTPSYMAPERLRGEEAGAPSDIFSLGATLVFASTGRDLVEDGTVYEQVLQIAQGRFDLSGVPPQVRSLVVRCVSFEPRDRPTAAELTRTIVALKTVSRVDADPGSLDDPEATLDVRAAATAPSVPPVPRAGRRAVILPRGPSETVVTRRDSGGSTRVTPATDTPEAPVSSGTTPVSPAAYRHGASTADGPDSPGARRPGTLAPDMPLSPGTRSPGAPALDGPGPAGAPGPGLTAAFSGARKPGMPDSPVPPGRDSPVPQAGRDAAIPPAGAPTPGGTSPGSLRSRRVSRRQALTLGAGLLVAGGAAAAFTTLGSDDNQAQPLPGSRSRGPSGSPGPPSPSGSPSFAPNVQHAPGTIIWAARSGLTSGAGHGPTGTAGCTVVVTPDGVIITATGGNVTARDYNGKPLGAYSAPGGVNGLWLWGGNVLVSGGGQLTLLDGTAHLIRGPITPASSAKVTKLGYGSQLPVADGIALSATRAYVTLGPVLACLDTKLNAVWARSHFDPTATSYPTAASASLLVTQALTVPNARFDVYDADGRHVSGLSYTVPQPDPGGQPDDGPPPGPPPGGGNGGGGPPPEPDGSDTWGITEARIGHGAIIARAGIDVRVFNPANARDFQQLSTTKPVTAIELGGSTVVIASNELQLYNLYNVHNLTSVTNPSSLRGARVTVTGSMIVAVGDGPNGAGWTELSKSGTTLRSGSVKSEAGSPSRVFPGSHVVYLVYPLALDSGGQPVTDVLAMAI